ncbi:hypothetical protein DL93DRAFT_404633 [Clavulina sp. PMI_390]|nr:hypothetical protein DL93DRAFT_404633 [Clavulina sp. PMI_390]
MVPMDAIIRLLALISMAAWFGVAWSAPMSPEILQMQRVLRYPPEQDRCDKLSVYHQCGGKGWSGSQECDEGAECVFYNQSAC